MAGASSVVVLDNISLMKVFKRVKANKLKIEDKQSDDKIKLRRDAYIFLEEIENRIGEVAQKELELGKEKVQIVFDAFGDDEVGEEEIKDFIEQSKKFFAEANKAQLNIKECSLDIKKYTSIEKAISDISSVLDETDPLTILMAFSGDPIQL